MTSYYEATFPVRKPFPVRSCCVYQLETVATVMFLITKFITQGSYHSCYSWDQM